MNDQLDFMQPYFLGPNAENAELLEKLLVEFVRDHAYWRRNFHPEDGPVIPASAPYDKQYLDFVSRMKTELYALSAELKRAVPFFHPRYIGHMASDLLLPGVIARALTTLYNPNNVAEEAAPVTLQKELEVGRQLARMFGLSTDEDQVPCAWGHLTSGGTVANYEGLWNLRSVMFYPIALAEAARVFGFDPEEIGPANKPLSSYSKWELLNLSIGETIDLRSQAAHAFSEGRDRREMYEFIQVLRSERIETLGMAAFFQKHADIQPPKVLVAASAHYSWAKGMKVLGLGTANLKRVAVDRHMRLDPERLAEALEETLTAEIPVLAVVGVLGTTEFGTVDPIHEIVALRDQWKLRGCHFAIHVDAAWGGYLATMFRREDGSLRTRDEMRKHFRRFPSPGIHRAFAALDQVDFLTVDPHKMGYVPYSAGAFVARDRRVVDFITQQAAYVFDLGPSEREVPMSEKLHNLGQYILEGSKPGAAAASVYVTHKVLPLHFNGFGRMLAQTIHACEYFYDKTLEIAERLKDRVRISVPFEPDTNLVCLLINPTTNRSLSRANRFGRDLFAAMKVDPSGPVQATRFIVSYTSLLENTLPSDQAERILSEIGVDPSNFQELPEPGGPGADHIFALRHTLMNPWLLFERDRKNYVDRYWEYLEDLIRSTLER